MSESETGNPPKYSSKSYDVRVVVVGEGEKLPLPHALVRLLGIERSGAECFYHYELWSEREA